MDNLRQLFTDAIELNQKFFDVSISEEKINALADFYEIVQKHNSILHLVAPSTPENFAVRHVLESLYLQKFLPQNAKFADIGAGAGLPSIPCLIFREDLHGVLIESKLKKVEFLEQVLAECKLENRAEILPRQFEELQKPVDVEFVTCRALDKFTRKLSKILKWKQKSNLLLFGGDNLAEELIRHAVEYQQKLVPQSKRRYLFVAQN